MPAANIQTATPDIVLGDTVNGAACSMMDFRIYAEALTAEEIAILASGRDVAKQPVGCWPCCEGRGDTIHDTSGGGNHGSANSISEPTFWAATQDKRHRNIREGFSWRRLWDPSDTAAAATSILTGTIPTGLEEYENETALNYAELNGSDNLVIAGTDPEDVYPQYFGVRRLPSGFHASLLGETITLEVKYRRLSASYVPLASLLSTGQPLAISSPSDESNQWYTVEHARTLSGTGSLYLIGWLSAPLAGEQVRYEIAHVRVKEFKVPALDDGSGAADGDVIYNAAGRFHNDAETKIDFTGGQPLAPCWDSARAGYAAPTTYAAGDTLPDGMSKQSVDVPAYRENNYKAT